MTGGPLAIAAPAKVNLYLAVGARRADGYHDVDTVIQALDLHDTVVVEPAAGLSVACEPDVGVHCDANLAAIAARALGRLVGEEPRVAIKLRKRIPAGGGLGGGSADAAAVLLGLARLWGIGPDDDLLSRAAAEVGADVPFFLIGGCALLSGRGDVLARRLPSPSPSLHLALVNPGVPVSTAAAYAAIDDAPPAGAPGVDALVAALERADPSGIAAALHNDMTAAAVGLVPLVADALALVSGSPGVLGAAMTGSGSTVFGIFTDHASAESAVKQACDRGWWASVARTRSGGVEILRTGEATEEGE
jgi:4-diphosphocytidyl-2-C-methyl-D-erythritol kinase